MCKVPSQPLTWGCSCACPSSRLSFARLHGLLPEAWKSRPPNEHDLQATQSSPGLQSSRAPARSCRFVGVQVTSSPRRVATSGLEAAIVNLQMWRTTFFPGYTTPMRYTTKKPRPTSLSFRIVLFQTCFFAQTGRYYCCGDPNLQWVHNLQAPTTGSYQLRGAVSVGTKVTQEPTTRNRAGSWSKTYSLRYPGSLFLHQIIPLKIPHTYANRNITYLTNHLPLRPVSPVSHLHVTPPHLSPPTRAIACFPIFPPRIMLKNSHTASQTSSPSTAAETRPHPATETNPNPPRCPPS